MNTFKQYPIYLVLLLCCLFFSSAQAQNGWTRKAKGFYTQLSISHFASNDYYSTEGQLFNEGSTFSSQGLLWFGEYGITDRLTATIDLPLLLLNRFHTTETVAGLGDIKLGVKYRLLSQFPLSLQVDLAIPTDDGIKLADVRTPNSLGFMEQINLPTSDGEFNIWTTLAASQSLPNGKTFGSLYTSINFRTEGFSHQFQAGLEIGHLFFDRLYLIGKLKVQEQLNAQNGTPNLSASFLYGEGTTYTSHTMTAMYKLNNQWNLVASMADFSGGIVERRNIYDGWTFSLGIALER